MKLAVYGTLRREFGNNRILGDNANFRGTRWLEGFKMYMLGDFSRIPGIKNGAGAVRVELWEDYDLDAVDVLEGHPYMYIRQICFIDGEECWVYLYRGDVEDRHEVESGDYKFEMQNRGDA